MDSVGGPRRVGGIEWITAATPADLLRSSETEYGALWWSLERRFGLATRRFASIVFMAIAGLQAWRRSMEGDAVGSAAMVLK